MNGARRFEFTTERGVDVAVHVTYGSGRRPRVTRIVMDGDDINSEDVRRLQIASFERIAVGTDKPLQSILRTKGESRSDFYARVAEQYRRALHISRHPAVEISRTSDVSIRTVHYWVREARRLGFLPPGHQGKAC